MTQMDLNKLTKETIKRPLTLYNQGRVSLEEMCEGIVQETLSNFGLFEKPYRTRELHNNLSNNCNKNESKISELYKEKVVIEEKPCKRLDIKADDYPFMNDKDIANILTTMEKVYIKKPIELSDVIDKLNEVIRKVNEL